MSSSIEVFVKGHPGTIKEAQDGHQGQLGACPFSARVLLALEEKSIPYTIIYVDLDHKPEWLTKINPLGTVPILKDAATDSYVVDSDTICDWLELKFGPDTEDARKPLGKVAECPQPGADLWPAFIDFIATGGGRDALEAQLKQIDGAVGDAHPYVGGQDPCAWDVALVPRLYLARVGCRALQNWDFADDFDNVKTYLHRWTGRQSWRNVASWDEESIVEELKTKVAKTQEK